MLRQSLSVLFLIILFSSCQQNLSKDNAIAKNNIKSDSITIGQKHIITSNVLNENRQILISLPDGYANSNASYPVLYLTDGFKNMEHVRGYVEILTRTGNIPPIKIVGIKSVNRERNFTLTKTESNQKSGGGKQFLSFIETELIPYIHSTYKTNSFRVLEGQYLGGLFADSTLIKKPEIYQSFIIMSPDFWWNNEELTNKAKICLKNNPTL